MPKNRIFSLIFYGLPALIITGMKLNLRLLGVGFGVVGLVVLLGATEAWQASVRLGKQPDDGFVVSSGQKINPGTLAFDGRPVDLALHPSGSFFAVLGQNNVFLATQEKLLEGQSVGLGTGAGFHGLVWSPDGTRLFASVSNGTVKECLWDGKTLTAGRRIALTEKGNPRPGGMALTSDGKSCLWR
jgi:WD40 repeat protein